MLTLKSFMTVLWDLQAHNDDYPSGVVLLVSIADFLPRISPEKDDDENAVNLGAGSRHPQSRL